MARVLIVDDNTELREAMARRLLRDGYFIFSASSIGEAIEFLETTPVDVIISEIVLPDRTGLELIEWIDSHKLQIETILTTEKVSMHSVRAATWAGAYDYLVKPIPPEILSRIVASAAKVRDLCKAKQEQRSDSIIAEVPLS